MTLQNLIEAEQLLDAAIEQRNEIRCETMREDWWNDKDYINLSQWIKELREEVKRIEQMPLEHSVYETEKTANESFIWTDKKSDHKNSREHDFEQQQSEEAERSWECWKYLHRHDRDGHNRYNGRFIF